MYKRIENKIIIILVIKIFIKRCNYNYKRNILEIWVEFFEWIK